MVMSQVRIADLKAHLSEHLRKVRRGRTLTILDRDTPIARLVPYSAPTELEMRPATRKPSEMKVLPPVASGTDGLAQLLEDRARR
jgi:prevent-host-death family protein